MNLKSVKIIAVDFDGTLCENSWPEIGEPNEELYADGKIIAQTVYCENRERCTNIYEFAHEKVGKEIGKDD